MHLKNLIGIENSETKGGSDNMKIRKGRLNITEFVSDEVIRKISAVQETVRPHRLKVEGWALSQAKIRGINVPSVLDYYQDKDGREVLVLERIQGQHLLWRCSQENIRCMSEVGEQILLLSNASLDCGWGWINPSSMAGVSESWQSFLLLYVQTYHKLFIEKNILEESHFQTVYRAIDSIDLSGLKPCLVHRDIKPSNLIKGNNGTVWIIDWENTILGDSLYDLATFGARYGHDILWDNLVARCEFDFSLPKYTFYEIIVLIGLIDFYREHKINYSGRQKQLRRLIQRFSSVMSEFQ